MDFLQTYSPPESYYEPPYPTLAEEHAWISAREDREDRISLTREELLNKIQADEEDVYEWDGDDPKNVGEPDYEDEGSYYFRGLPFVRVSLKDGRIYYMTDGESVATFEKRVDPAELQEVTNEN